MEKTVEDQINDIYPKWVDKLVTAIILLVIILAIMETAIYIALGG